MNCPDCSCLLSNYNDDGYLIVVCWNCGYYMSDSPAYTANPHLFENIVRENPQFFMRKFLKAIPADESLQGKRTDKDFTEP